MDDTLLNGGLLGNSSQKESTEAQSGSFVFDGFNLNDGKKYRVLASNHDDVGSIAFETYNAPRSDGGGALSKYYRTKTITLSIAITGTDGDNLNDLVDELKLATQKMEGYLDITINGIVRRRTATLTELKCNRQSYNVDFLQNVSLSFSCVNPIAFEVNSNSKTFSQVSGDYEFEISYSGKITATPTVYLIFNQALGLTEINLNTNGYNLKLSNTFTTGDVIIIDGDSKLAKLNGTTIIYSGLFPEMEAGINHFKVSMNSQALTNYDVVVIYQNKYL